ISRSGDRKTQALKAAARALPSADQLLALPRRRFDEAAARLARGLEIAVERKGARLAQARLSPATLARRTREARQRLAREGEQLPKCAASFLRTRRSSVRETTARLRIEPIAVRLGNDGRRLTAVERRAETAFINRTERARTRLV